MKIVVKKKIRRKKKESISLCQDFEKEEFFLNKDKSSFEKYKKKNPFC